MYPTVDLDKPAITMYPSGRTLTHRELRNKAAQFANVLQATGAPDAGGVAFLLANQVDCPVGLLGARLAGFDHLMLNTGARLPEQIAIINQFGPQMLVVSDTFAEHAAELRPLLNPHIRFVMTGEACAGWESLGSLLVVQSTEPPVAERPGRLLLLSGGSTGTPKIVIRPNAHQANAARQGSALSFLPLDRNSVLFIPAPLYHTMPIGWLIGGLDAYAHVVILERWHCEQTLEAIQRFRVTLLPLVPTMMKRLLDLPKAVRDSYDVSSIMAVMHGAAPCPVQVKEAFMDWIPPVWEGYGMTEGYGMCRISPEEWLRHRGSVGRPVQGCRVVIRDEAGRELSPGKIGIVWFIRDDGAYMSYFDDPEATAATYNEHGEGTTLDMGYVDEKGFLYLVGRQKRMLIVGGVNVYPEPIENAFLEHVVVRDAGVIGVPDEIYGEVPVALVELHDEWAASDAVMRELTAWCADRINRRWRLRRIVFVKRVPRLATGKLDVRALAELVK